MKKLIAVLAAAFLALLTVPASAGQISGDVLGCPDNGYRIEQRKHDVKVTIKFARTDFNIDYYFDGVKVLPRYGAVSFVDPEGNQDYSCSWAYFRIHNTGKWVRIGEKWEGDPGTVDGGWSMLGRYRVR